MKDDSFWAALRSLRTDLDRAEFDLRILRVRADQLGDQITAASRQEQETAAEAAALVDPLPLPPSSPPLPTVPPIIPPPLPETAAIVAERQPPPAAAAAFALPPKLPATSASPEPPPVIPEERIETYFTAQTKFSELPPPSVPPTPPAQPESFEMRLGTYWFVRIGIVMVLTALAFLGNYAYQHYIGLVGPGGKIALMYGASFGLLAAGKILPRKHASLKNYGQVLFAGGLAAVYFTTYAAHHFENVRIISSALLDGLLLFGWTAFIVWLADRHKSELLAVFAIGLAYYTGLITDVGSFTLLSNLLLAAAAVFFLVRNRWVSLTFLSLAASYGSYFYWRYYAGTAHSDQLTGQWAIVGYWMIFTTAVFLTRDAAFAGRRRASFLSFNNGAAFCLLAATLYHQHTGNFWKLALASGTMLLALAPLARKFLKEDQLPSRAYLTQGLLLATLGIISKLSGPTLALVLATESAWLLIFSTQWKSRITRFGSIITAALAAAFLINSFDTGDALMWWKAAGIGSFLLFNAIWSGRHETGIGEDIRPQPVYFSLLALGVWSFATFRLADPTAMGLILVGTGFALTLAHRFVRVPEIPLLSQAVIVIGQAVGFFYLLAHPGQQIGFEWTYPALIAMTLALTIWWKRQSSLQVEDNSRFGFEATYAVTGAALVALWAPELVSPSHWIYLSIVLSVVWLGFGFLARSWPTMAAGQIFLVGAYFQTLAALIDGHEPPMTCAIAVFCACFAFAAIGRLLKEDKASSVALSILSHIYQWAGAVLVVASVMTYLASPLRFLVLTLAFAGSLAGAARGARYPFWPGLAMASAGAFWWLIGWPQFGAEWQSLVAILILAGAQALLRKRPESNFLNEQGHYAWIAAVAGALWLYVSRVVIVQASGEHFYLTASWAILAFVLFGAGFVLRERLYRWAALTVLGSALARVIILDVWKLETLYRILSFLALGIVLLALGYVYTRFQERIAKWL